MPRSTELMDGPRAVRMRFKELIRTAQKQRPAQPRRIRLTPAVVPEGQHIDGDVEGTIELQENRLTIGPNGKVRSNITAHKVVILGNVQGSVDARDKLEVRKDATAVGTSKRHAS